MFLIRCCLIFVCFLIAAAVAQVFPPLDGTVATDSSQLNLPAINRAATALIEQNVIPVAIFIEAPIGRTLEDAQRYFAEALEYYGYLQDGNVPSNLLAVFVGTSALTGSEDARPLYLRYGSRLEPVFFLPREGTTGDAFLQEQIIVPRLVSGDYSAALSSTFREAAALIQLDQLSPPALVPGAPQTNATGFNPFMLIALLAAIGIFWFGMSRSRVRRSRQVATDIGEQLTATKSELSMLLIDLSSSDVQAGHDPYLPIDPMKQSDMALLSGLLAEERPAHLVQLQSDYLEAVDTLGRIETSFKSLRTHEERSGDAQSLESYLAEYQELLQQARQLRQFTVNLAEEYQSVQQEVSRLPSEIGEVADHLAQLRQLYAEQKSLHWPEVGRVLEPLETELNHAKALKDTKPLTAARLLGELAAHVDIVQSSISRLQDVDARLDTFIKNLAGYRSQGYTLTDKDRLLAELRQQQEVAFGLLKQSEYKVLDAQIEEVFERSDQLLQAVTSAVDLQQQNSQRLTALEAEGEVVKNRIEQGVLAFQQVSAFAPSSWRDIRGNGTEAQKAAERAFQLWLLAQDHNSLEGASQDFEQAAKLLDEVAAELNQCHALIDSIDARLKQLRHAQATASTQLTQVEADLAAHQQYLRQPAVDREVGPRADSLLHTAQERLRQARSTLNAEAIDWLEVLRLVQEADRLSDELLNFIRSEQEKVQHLRQRLESERAEAEIALQRVQQFVRVHQQDITAVTLQLMQQSQSTLQQAEQLMQQTDSLAEELLVSTLERSATTFDQAETLAEQAFQQAEQDFSLMEKLRKDAAAAVAEVKLKYQSLEQLVAHSGLNSDFQRSLHGLAASLPQFKPNLDRAALQSVISQSGQLSKDIDALLAEVRRQQQLQETALRQERMRQLEQAQQRQAVDWARQSSEWGNWIPAAPARRSAAPVFLPAPRSPRSSPQTRSRPTPRPPTPRSVSRPSPGRVSGGGWGGSGRKSGGGW